jgi:hypothetical protein
MVDFWTMIELIGGYMLTHSQRFSNRCFLLRKLMNELLNKVPIVKVSDTTKADSSNGAHYIKIIPLYFQAASQIILLSFQYV